MKYRNVKQKQQVKPKLDTNAPGASLKQLDLNSDSAVESAAFVSLVTADVDTVSSVSETTSMFETREPITCQSNHSHFLFRDDALPTYFANYFDFYSEMSFFTVLFYLDFIAGFAFHPMVHFLLFQPVSSFYNFLILYSSIHSKHKH